MKLWISGEIQADVADDYRMARSHVEKAVNAVIEDVDYDLPVDGWDCIGILRDDCDFKERTTYSATKRDMDFRLQIDYEAFKAADGIGREALVYAMLNRSLSILGKKIGTANDLEKLRSTVHEIAVNRGWAREE